jgi:hypothetical protein
MRLWEEVTDERGDKFASELGVATWDQTPDAPKRDLVLELNARPKSDTLFLETDNGDNPAIELRDFRGYYPATRVIFKATPDPAPPTWLYYGTLDATAPSYDLTLVAGELLKADRSTVAAGAEENLSPKPSFAGQTLTGSTRYIFWGALALVVIVLLAIMSRFLPKASNNDQKSQLSLAHETREKTRKIQPRIDGIFLHYFLSQFSFV